MNKRNRKYNRLSFSLFISLLIICLSGRAAFSQSGSRENSGYLNIVRAYADAMITKGRDRYGSEHSPLFASALNRKTMQPGTADEFGAIGGIRENDRSLGGSNPLWETGLYDILYRLSEITGDPKYAGEADKALGWFFTHCQSGKTGLMAWGEHLFWDFGKESVGYVSANNDYHEANVWPFQDRCYTLAPDACWRFAIGEWNHQVADKITGDFSRHAKWSEHGPQKGSDFPRYAGQMIERWADAWYRMENRDRPDRSELFHAIDVLLGRMEENMKKTATGYLPAFRGADYAWPTSNLELARCLTEAAPKVSSQLADRMKRLANQQDINFLKAPHKLDEGGGFAVTLHSETGEPRSRSMNKPYTATWDTGYGYGTHAGAANLCFKRYVQLFAVNPGPAMQYRELILSAAGQYLNSAPDTTQLLKPDAFSEVIELLINSYTLSGEEKYLTRADWFAKQGISLFLNDGLPLPKATNRHNHYETITGGPDFMKTLLDLSLLPVKAENSSGQAIPFEFPDLQPPVFKNQIFDIRKYGAKSGDSTFMNTNAIKKTIDACAKAGGGKVLVPAGTWYTGPIHLKSNINLHLDEGAELRFSKKYSDYLPVVLIQRGGIMCYNYSPPLYAYRCENVAVTGSGMLNGQGQAWWPWKKRQPGMVKLFEMGEKETPVEERVFGTEEAGVRPPFIQFLECTNIYLQGITVKDGPSWNIHPVFCENLIIREVKVIAHGPNNDGIDPDGCKNVLIEDCFIDVGDDNICLKSGRDREAWLMGRPCENVVVRGCTTKAGHGGLTIGSEMSASVKNVLVENCTFNGTDIGLRFKSRVGRRGVVENIWARNITMDNIKNAAIDFNMQYDGEPIEKAMNYAEGNKSLADAPVFRNFHLENMVCRKAKYAINLTGLPGDYLKEIHLNNLKIASEEGLTAKMVNGVYWTNVNIIKTGSGSE